jgi:hypothetical protein
MSMKVLQFPAQGSTRAIRLRAVPAEWVEAYGASHDSGFLSSWLEDDSEPNHAPGRINWGAISGLALSLGISAGFWAVVGLMVERILR